MIMEIRVDIGADERCLSMAKCSIKSVGDSIILKKCQLVQSIHSLSVVFLFLST